MNFHQYTKGIMVIDDDPGRLRLVALFLHRAGFIPLSFRSAHEALEAINIILPDLFVISSNVDDSNGLDLCRTLRQCDRTTHTPILLVTMYGDQCALHSPALATECLTIPFVSFDLITRVNNLLAIQMPE